MAIITIFSVALVLINVLSGVIVVVASAIFALTLSFQAFNALLDVILIGMRRLAKWI